MRVAASDTLARHGGAARGQVRAVRPLGNGMRASQQLRSTPEALAALTPSTGPPPTGRREFGLPDAMRKRAGGASTPLEVWLTVGCTQPLTASVRSPLPEQGVWLRGAIGGFDISSMTANVDSSCLRHSCDNSTSNLRCR